jgi:deoxyribonuclease V
MASRKRLRSEKRPPAAWPKTIPEARALQLLLKEKIHLVPPRKPPRLIAGVDAAFLKDKIIAAACLFTFPELTLLEEAFAIQTCSFPYRPGYLSFREGPAIIEALGRLKKQPDLILFDGQGIAHPRRMGIASFTGVIIDLPAIGCAKSRLIGGYREPGGRKGDWSVLKHRGETVGAVLRTRADVRPLFVSPGHRVDLESSIRIVLDCTRNYRIPEPLRAAHFLSHQIASGSSTILSSK